MRLLCSGEVNTQLILEKLNKLHSQIFKPGAFSNSHLLYTIVTTLLQMFNKDDQVISSQVKQLLAGHALESGWLNPEPEAPIQAAMQDHHKLLRYMKNVEELAPLATTCLQKWYDNWLGRDRYSQLIFQSDNAYSVAVVSNDHGCISAFLETNIITRALASSWTDEPEGVPNIERLLTRNPAYPTFGEGKTAHRPLIIMGSPDWSKTSKEEIADKLYQRYLQNYPEVEYLDLADQLYDLLIVVLADTRDENDSGRKQSKRFSNGFTEEHLYRGVELLIKWIDSRGDYSSDSLGSLIREWLSDISEFSDFHSNEAGHLLERMKNILLQLYSSNGGLSSHETSRLHTIQDSFGASIHLAFCHYLYEITHSNGGRLLVCWMNTKAYDVSKLECGYHEPRSPVELVKMLSIPYSDLDIDHYHLLKTHNAKNGVILKNSEITTIAREFTDSVDVDSLYDEVCQYLNLKAC